MKKMLIISLLCSVFLLVEAMIVDYRKEDDEIIKFVYISYLEYLTNFNGNSVKINQTKIDKMLDNIAYYQFNTIILHVSPFSDVIYPSKLFPYSHTLSGKEGKNPGFDYLDYFIKKAHQRKIKVHAWINPYRVSSSSDISKLSEDNPVYRFIDTENISISDKGIYYDPTSELVKELIVEQVYEIVKNYNVDGIHLDDYFYIDYHIDDYEYELFLKNGGKLSRDEFRLSHTNDLIKRLHDQIKAVDQQIVFSIAPDGNINNNYKYHYADVKTWIKEEYIDIIMPQLYYGFNNQYLPFEKAYNLWHDLIIDTKVLMVPVLSFYKIGVIDNNAGSGKNEWLDNGVITKQINYLSNKDDYYGYGLFRYDHLFTKNVMHEKAKKELEDIKNNVNYLN